MTEGGVDDKGVTEVVKEVQLIVGAKVVGEVVAKVQGMAGVAKKYKKYKELFEKLEGLVKEMMPPEEHSDPANNAGSPDTPHSSLEVRDVWRWIRNLVEQYYKLKQQQLQSYSDGHHIKRVLEAADVQDTEELEEVITCLSTQKDKFVSIMQRVQQVVSQSDSKLASEVAPLLDLSIF